MSTLRSDRKTLLEAVRLSEAILSEVFGRDPDVVAESNPAVAGVLRLLRYTLAAAQPASRERRK
jgi:hypothetical protein